MLKLYVPVLDLPYFVERLAATNDELLSAAIAATEVLCALYRMEQAGDLQPGKPERV